MAGSLIPKNGALSYGALVADFHSFDINSTQATEEVTPYGANKCAKNVGNGTPSLDFAILAYALAHVAATAPAMDTAAAAGVACVFTLDTGVTETVTVVQKTFRISHGRMRAAVPYAITGVNFGDVVEVWPVS